MSADGLRSEAEMEGLPASELSDEEVWNWASGIHDEGRSDGHRGRYSMDPTLHLLPRGTGTLWCTGGPAVEANTARRRWCRRCLRLAREMWDDLAEPTSHTVRVEVVVRGNATEREAQVALQEALINYDWVDDVL